MTAVLQRAIAEEGEKTRNLVQEEANKTRTVVREESQRLSEQFATYKQEIQTLIDQQRTENALRSVSAGAQLETLPVDAEIYLNDKKVGQGTPLILQLPKGNIA